MLNYTYIIIPTLSLSLSLTWFIKPIRFYIMSFFVEWFNENEFYGKLLGVKYENDYDPIFNRKESKIYTPGIYKMLTEWFIGININLEFDLYKKLVRQQFDMSRKISLQSYIETLKDKHITIEEFEDFIAESFLIEMNTNFNVLDKDSFQKIQKHNRLIRTILNSLTGETDKIFLKILSNITYILDLRRILLSLAPEVRLFVVVPQFTILNKFVEMIVEKKGNLENLEFHEFVKPGSFLTILNKNELYIIRRHADKTNSYCNIGFGVKGFQCPASKFVFNVITNIIDNLKKYNIKIDGVPIYAKSKRFQKIILNKRDIHLTFNHSTKEDAHSSK